MADSIQLSQKDAESAKLRITTKSDTWINNMSSIEKEVSAMANWFKGETGAALILLYQKCQKDIQKDIHQFIGEYNGTIDRAVSSLQDADHSVAKQIEAL